MANLRLGFYRLVSFAGGDSLVGAIGIYGDEKCKAYLRIVFLTLLIIVFISGFTGGFID